MAREISILVGGKAGDGINSAGSIVAQMLNHLGYYIYMNYDYPSLIRGGHNFAIIRGSEFRVGVHLNMVDFVLALNQDTIALHRAQFRESTAVIFNSDLVKTQGQGISVSGVLRAQNAPEIMGNSAMIGAFAKAAGIPWDIVKDVFSAHMPKGAEENLRVAGQGYDLASTVSTVAPAGSHRRSLITGNEAIGLGMVAGGLSSYISYPMTPSSSLLHFLAENAERFGISVVHPENEIAVVLMALGCSYAGLRAALGTSGGGFCLMTEGLSLAGMAELPLVLVVSQRTGPSTGLPTYTAQSDLQFILNAGQGEFPRFVAAPGDAHEAYAWSAAAMDIAWRYQVPAFILADKTLSEGLYSVDPNEVPRITPGNPSGWDGKAPYRRYADTPSGISPLASPGMTGAVVKVNSYAHDESGITTEEAETVVQMTRKRLRKGRTLSDGMGMYDTVNVSGAPDAGSAIVCWGSTKGACGEVADKLGMRVVRPVVLSPFPAGRLKNALEGVSRLIVIEENATGQLAALLRLHGIPVDAAVLHCDGRQLTPDIIVSRMREVMA